MSKRRERGSALPLVLWVTSVLLIIALSLTLLVQSRARRIEMLFDRLQAYLEATSTIQYGLDLLLTGTRKPTEILTADLTFFPDGNRYFLDGTSVSIPLFANKTRLSFQDYAGLINLRMIRPELIDGLMKQFGMPEETRSIFIDSLLDWIDPDDFHRLNGAEKDYYKPLGYAPSNNPLMTLDETLLIRGMEESLYPKIQPFLILGANEGVNPNAAPYEVLMSLPHMTEEAARAVMESRKRGYIGSVTAFSTISKINYAFYETLFSFVPGPSLIIQASAPLGANNRYQILCHVKRRFGSSSVVPEGLESAPTQPSEPWPPYVILLWKETVR
jgi:general secretion pathway protein K